MWDSEKKKELMLEMELLRSQGYKPRQAVRVLGVPYSTMLKWLEGGDRKFKRGQISRAYYALAERMRSEIPEDTRGITGVLCGDPLPGRSALDHRHA